MKTNLIYILTLSILLAVNAAAQRQSVLIAPQTTDPEITTNLNNHYVSLNRSIASKNQLFVFFAGTGGVAFNYLEINNTAADLGFHAVNLNYPNDEAVNELCQPFDLDCCGNVRLEVKDGTDRTPLVSVNRANSIENRLIKLLIFLRNQSPNDNWGQFLNGDLTVNWSKIIVAGHSQGGGHAGIIGRYHAVVRVVMFSWHDFSGRLNAPTNWIAFPDSTPNASTPDKFWGFSHLRDDKINFNILSTRVWPAFGIPQYGAIVNVDAQNPPYGNTHSLTTDLPCEVAHGCTIADGRLTRLPSGVPVYKPVWEYLLSNTTSPMSLTSLTLLRSGTAVGSQLVGLSTKYYEIRINGNGFDQSAAVIINGTAVPTEFLSTSELKAKLLAGTMKALGTSSVQIRNLSNNLSNSLSF